MVSHHVYEGSIYMNVLRNDHLQIVLVDNDETLGILHETMGTVDMMVMELSKNPGVPLFYGWFLLWKILRICTHIIHDPRHKYKYICINIFTCTDVQIEIRTNNHINIFKYIYTHVYAYIYICIYIYMSYLYIYYIKKKVLVISQRALHLLLQLYTLQCSCTRLAQCLVQAALNIFIQNHPQPSFFCYDFSTHRCMLQCCNRVGRLGQSEHRCSAAKQHDTQTPRCKASP